MVKCAVCNKKRSELDMRPLVNVDELDLANDLAGAGDKDGVEATREVAGSELQVVCRRCWIDILKGMDKDDVIEQLETLCGLLFEIERKAVEQASERMVIIEKERNPLLPLPTGPVPAVPLGPYVAPFPIPTPMAPVPGSPWAPTPHDTSDPRWGQIWCHGTGNMLLSGVTEQQGQAVNTAGSGGTFTGSVAFDAGRTMGATWQTGGNAPDDDDELGAPARAAS